MPLPPTLAAKLAKRGIIIPKQKSSEKKKTDYRGVSICPNKNNIYHDCTHWCETHWKGVLAPDPKYVLNMQKLIGRYPLPNNWIEVFDKGLGRYYYWNMESDLVSWLPPRHPKALVTKSAAKLRENRILQEKDDQKRKLNSDSVEPENNEPLIDNDTEDSDKEEDSDEEETNRYRSRTHSEYHKDNDKERERDDKQRSISNKRERDDRPRRDKRFRRDEHVLLDPMDPAAYSDIPQGTWSDGLENNRLRADNTASGVLFQQRPYPAPGAVLAANKEKEKDKRK